MSISIQNASVHYGDVVAVDGVSVEVDAGEIVALLGPSGCGKSSLLRAVAGLEPLVGGSIAIAGTDMSGVPVHERNVGMVFQDGALFAHHTVGGNIAYGLRAHKWNRADADRRVTELLELVGLAGMADRDVATLSGGQAQRVALARSLAPQPAVLLLDEPLSALDRRLRERLSGDLRSILRAAGVTALYVTHDHAEAFSVAGTVGIMDAGRLLTLATPRDLVMGDQSTAVREFLDSAPVISASKVGAGHEPGLVRVRVEGTVEIEGEWDEDSADVQIVPVRWT